MSARRAKAGASVRANALAAATGAALAALAALAAFAATGCQTGAERAGAQFLNRYFVEANQAEALQYTRGLAAERLRREIEDTRAARAIGGVTTDARRVYYELVGRTDVRVDHVDLVYRLEVVADGSRYFRDVGLSMDLVGENWLVSQFTEFSETAIDVPEPAFTARPATTTAATAASAATGAATAASATAADGPAPGRATAASATAAVEPAPGAGTASATAGGSAVSGP